MFKIQQLMSLFLQLVKGIIYALGSASSMVELEKDVQKLVQQIAARLLEFSLNEIDTRLSKKKEPGKYKNLGIRSRPLLTTVGEIELKRRYYKDRETGEHHFLLDESLGLVPRRRISPRLERMMLEMGTETTFRKASNTLEYLVPGISHATVWDEVQRAGARAKQEAEEKQGELFEDGVIPEGKRSVNSLNIEADGVMIRQQRSTTRHKEVKLIVGYESKEHVSQERKRLINRKTVAGAADGNTIWEQASAIFGGEWQFDGEEKIRIGGDGAAWVKEGTDVFPGATYHLDLFHLRKRLTEALGFNKNYYQTVAEKLYEIDLDGLKEALGSILKKTKGEAKRKKVANLQKYILNNWEGISNLPKEDRLGVIEGQVRHTIARRMKGIGGGWSSTGTDHMARLLAAKANNELVKYSGVSDGYKRDQIASVLPKTLVDPRSKSSKKDTNEWLAAAMPVLEGPSSGKTWVKYVLRQLTSVRIA
ncbi:MAG: ISLre2 family transposase [Syntrophaceticus sp.]|jgi:hypothetical protein